MNMKIKLLVALLWVGSALIQTPVYARTIYFVGSANSNFTIDLTSWHTTSANMTAGIGSNALTAANVAFDFGTMTCRVFIWNGSTNDQRIDNAQVNINIEYPTYPAGHAFKLSDIVNPILTPANAMLVYTTDGNSAAIANDFYRIDNNLDGSTLTQVTAFPIGLSGIGAAASNGQGLLIEASLSGQKSVRYTNGWYAGSTGAKPMWPYVKMHHTCSGSITVTDVAPNAPGFVVATGSLSYVGDSYQNMALPTGGAVFNTRSEVGVTSRVKMSADSAVLIDKYSPWSAPEGWNGSSLSPGVIQVGAGTLPSGSMAAAVASRLSGYSAAFGSAIVDYFIDNNWTRSSFQPAHIKTAPIVINGGNPI